jgi:hypothetical protein
MAAEPGRSESTAPRWTAKRAIAATKKKLVVQATMTMGSELAAVRNRKPARTVAPRIATNKVRFVNVAAEEGPGLRVTQATAARTPTDRTTRAPVRALDTPGLLFAWPGRQDL